MFLNSAPFLLSLDLDLIQLSSKFDNINWVLLEQVLKFGNAYSWWSVVEVGLVNVIMSDDDDIIETFCESARSGNP